MEGKEGPDTPTAPGEWGAPAAQRMVRSCSAAHGNTHARSELYHMLTRREVGR